MYTQTGVQYVLMHPDYSTLLLVSQRLTHACGKWGRQHTPTSLPSLPLPRCATFWAETSGCREALPASPYSAYC